ncbi:MULTISPECIES: cysteine hydrolase family protein [unclassified Bradyrhizobium]|uniref:cysteine hydrolase family protein n=1 Tax=unclassified Bradyrhizobium TaxID=2631580 RepID=UPI001BADF3C8|nr:MULTISPECIES: cysteine hydrolase family protein [unclassified Bradyrhizobium]MBR1204303.1 cysteine hydrolase [Bradyrhizobium sp. AUGA SZCCT0124]MBR1309811.1 cysteine hydrolase [Bradyrhizobium sp. AUGA SZCCT0051]MBR1339952.1 cysteine hydrolase [Bradyrhizobium sp. AUGA SZCCT0105]MBR1354559.1 cysteine hydrolase [Bradyrhizobium sp. AUGA SZCCT0045]
MTAAKTLMQLAGIDLTPPRLGDSCLVLIDIQNEYLAGPLALPDAKPAIARATALLARARESGAVIIHIAHKGAPGSLFDRTAERGAIVAPLAPRPGEIVIEKQLPNAFAGTDLNAQLAATGRKELVLAGFMTHMCVSSTARAALDLGFRTTIDADSCATRDLPDGTGGTIAAKLIHDVALAELSDRFAIIARGNALA